MPGKSTTEWNSFRGANARVSGSVPIVEFRDKQYMAFKGAGGSDIFVGRYEGTDWDIHKIRGAGSSDAPAMCVFSSYPPVIYVSHN